MATESTTAKEFLLDILKHTFDLVIFDLLRIYHIKSTVTDTIPDRNIQVLYTEPDKNYMVTNNVAWLQTGQIVRVSTSEIPDELYYITNVFGDFIDSNCVKFTIGLTPNPLDVLDIPDIQDPFDVTSQDSFLVVNNTDWMDIGDRVLLETVFDNFDRPNVPATGFAFGTRYYITEIIDNKVRLSNSLGGDYIHFNTGGGYFEIVKDHSYIEAVSEDNVVTLVGQTDYKVPFFDGEFGMKELDKLAYMLENSVEYPGNSFWSETSFLPGNTDEIYTSKFSFDNGTQTFEDEYIFLSPEELFASHNAENFEGSLWNFSFVPSADSLQKLEFMAKTYNGFLYFDAYTNPIDYRNEITPTLPHYELEFTFGENRPNFGKILFEPYISGTYVPSIWYNYKTQVTNIIKDKRAKIKGVTKDIYTYTVINVDWYLDRLEVLGTSNLTLLPGMKLTFAAFPDSTLSLEQATLDPTKTYYIKYVYGCSTIAIAETIDAEPKLFPYSNWNFQFSMTLETLPVLNIEIETFDNTILPLRTTIEHDISWIKKGHPYQFIGGAGAGLEDEVTYYITNISEASKERNSTDNGFIHTAKFSISKDIEGENLPLTETTDEFTLIEEKLNWFYIEDTRWLKINDPIKVYNITGNEQGLVNLGLFIDQQYFVKEILDNNRLILCENIGGPSVNITAFAPLDIDIGLYKNDNKGVLFTSHPAVDFDAQNSKFFNTIYGPQYNTISNEAPVTFQYDNIENLQPSSHSIIDKIKIGTTNLYDDNTINNPLLDNKYAYGFEYNINTLNTHFPSDSSLGNEVKIYDAEKKGWTMPVGFLAETWTYPLPQVLAIMSDAKYEDAIIGGNTVVIPIRGADKKMYFSDQGNLMIRLDSEFGIYNYIIPAKNKP